MKRLPLRPIYFDWQFGENRMKGFRINTELNKITITPKTDQSSYQYTLDFLSKIVYDMTLIELVSNSTDKQIWFTTSRLQHNLTPHSVENFARLVMARGGLTALLECAENHQCTPHELYILNGINQHLKMLPKEGLESLRGQSLIMHRLIEAASESWHDQLFTLPILNFPLPNASVMLDQLNVHTDLLSNLREFEDVYLTREAITPLAKWSGRKDEAVLIHLENNPQKHLKQLGEFLRKYSQQIDYFENIDTTREPLFICEKLHPFTVLKMQKLLKAVQTGKLDELPPQFKLTLHESVYISKSSTQAIGGEKALIETFIQHFIQPKREATLFLNFAISSRCNPSDRFRNYFVPLERTETTIVSPTETKRFFFFKRFNKSTPRHRRNPLTKEYVINPCAFAPSLPEKYQQEFKNKFTHLLQKQLENDETEYYTQKFAQKHPNLIQKKFFNRVTTIYFIFRMFAGGFLARILPGRAQKIQDMSPLKNNCAEFMAFKLAMTARQTCMEMNEAHPDLALEIPEYMDILGFKKNINPHEITPYLLARTLKNRKIIHKDDSVIPYKKFIKF